MTKLARIHSGASNLIKEHQSLIIGRSPPSSLTIPSRSPLSELIFVLLLLVLVPSPPLLTTFPSRSQHFFFIALECLSQKFISL